MLTSCLSIAGSDPSGGAGIQADLKTFHQFGCWGLSAISLLTVQNTVSVEQVKVMEPEFVHAQIKAVLKDIPPQSVKTGALGNAEVIDAVFMHARNFDFPYVLDPVMLSKHGSYLLDDSGQAELKRKLLGTAYLLTPNIPEAEVLSEYEIKDISTMERAAISLSKLGPKNVLIKGGHLDAEATDVLYHNKLFYRFPSRRIESRHTHGTGCVYSAAITACLSQNKSLLDSIKIAKQFISRAIATAPGLGSAGGHGPVNIFAPIQ